MAEEKTVEEQIKEAIEASEKGLKQKNKDLMKEAKDAKALLKKFDGVDLKALLKDAKDLADLRTNKKKEDGDYKKLYEDQQEQHKTDIATSTKELSETKDTLSKERRLNALTQALVESFVEPVLVNSAAKLLDSSISITDEGVAMAGDKTVNDFVKDWTINNDVGKKFVTDANLGGGANGGGGKGNVEAAFFDPNSPTFSVTEQSKIANADQAKYKALKASAPAKKEATA